LGTVVRVGQDLNEAADKDGHVPTLTLCGNDAKNHDITNRSPSQEHEQREHMERSTPLLSDESTFQDDRRIVFQEQHDDFRRLSDTLGNEMQPLTCVDVGQVPAVAVKKLVRRPWAANEHTQRQRDDVSTHVQGGDPTPETESTIEGKEKKSSTIRKRRLDAHEGRGSLST
jgi:hypothetical protein